MTFAELEKGRPCRDRIVVGFTTIYVISIYHHKSCEFETDEVYSIQHYVTKFVSYLRQTGGFHRVLRFPTPITLKMSPALYQEEEEED